MNRLALIGILAVSLLFPHTAGAWSSAGHMTISAMAYQRLPAEAQRKVDTILQGHPRFGEWKAQWTADMGVSLGLFVFMRASCWPDEIRQEAYTWVKVNGVPVEKDGQPVVDPALKAERDAHDHPAWHFTNWPLKPPDFPVDERPSPEDDVVYAINQSRIVLHGEHTDADERAAALAWLAHVVADVHQPLHCAAMFGPRFPYGDKGGNWFVVRMADQEPANLHSLWDGVLGIPPVVSRVMDAARRLDQDAELARAKLPELATDTSAEAWSLEGRALAISTVYLRGALEPAPATFALDPETKRPALLHMEAWNARPLPSDYGKNAVAAAKRCFALASCRLEDELRNLPHSETR